MTSQLSDNLPKPRESEKIVLAKSKLKKYSRISNEFVYYSNPYTSLQLNIFYLAINSMSSGKYKIEPDENGVKSYFNLFNDLEIHIPASLLATKDFRNIVKACDNMLAGFKYFDADKEEYIGISPFSIIKYSSQTKHIEISVSAAMHYLLTNLSGGFAKPEMRSILSLNSKIDKKLYVLISTQRQNRKLIISESSLRFALGIEDIYKETKSFNRAVIKKSLQRISEITDLQCSSCFIKSKTLGKENHYQFKIENIKGLEAVAEAKEEAESAINRHYCLTVAEQSNEVCKYTEQYNFDIFDRHNIISDKDKLSKFIAIHFKIECGVLSIKTSEKAYILSACGLLDEKTT